MQRIGSGMVAMVLALVASAALGGCALGASEITVTARNDAEQEMIVQVFEGSGGDGEPYGPAHTLLVGEEREVELAVPGGGWTVTVNGARLLGSSDAGARRGRLPVTLILPAPDHVAGGPYWEAPQGWAGVEE